MRPADHECKGNVTLGYLVRLARFELRLRQGFEPEERCFCKPLTARKLWHNGFVSLHLRFAIESTRVLSSLPESTGVVEE